MDLILILSPSNLKDLTVSFADTQKPLFVKTHSFITTMTLRLFGIQSRRRWGSGRNQKSPLKTCKDITNGDAGSIDNHDNHEQTETLEKLKCQVEWVKVKGKKHWIVPPQTRLGSYLG